MSSKFDAFISYSHADCGDIAPSIQKGIQQIGKPWYRLKRNLNVFRDESNLTASPELWNTIETALMNSKYFILFASSIASTSYWVSKEIGVWIDRHYSPDAGLRNIIIVLTQGNIEWSHENADFNWDVTNCLPKNVLSGKFKSEPLWVDLRPYVQQGEKGKTVDYKAAGFTTAMTKIIGQILGVEPWKIESDEVRRTRNIKQFLVGVTMILVSLLITSGVLFLRERKAKFAEKNAKQTAEARRIEAENNLRDFKVEKFQRDIRNANVYLEAQEYCFAKALFIDADSTLKNPLYANDHAIVPFKDTLEASLELCRKKCPE